MTRQEIGKIMATMTNEQLELVRYLVHEGYDRIDNMDGYGWQEELADIKEIIPQEQDDPWTIDGVTREEAIEKLVGTGEGWMDLDNRDWAEILRNGHEGYSQMTNKDLMWLYNDYIANQEVADNE